MIVDSSALIAALQQEPDADRILSLLGHHGGRISAATVVEARIVAASKGGPHGVRRLDDLIRQFDIEVVSVDSEQADVASAAYRDYGKASRHGARLNFGDTFSYALAFVADEPLLYVGDDFARTDIRSALEEDGE